MQKNQIIIDPVQLAGVTRAEKAEQALAEIGCRKLGSHDSVWVAPSGKVRAARAVLREHLTPGVIVSEARYAALTEEQKALPISYWNL